MKEHYILFEPDRDGKGAEVVYEKVSDKDCNELLKAVTIQLSNRTGRSHKDILGTVAFELKLNRRKSQ